MECKCNRVKTEKIVSFSAKLNQVSYIVSIAKIASEKIEAFISFVRFLMSEAVFYH